MSFDSTAKGHDVTIMSRHKPTPSSLDSLSHLQGDYINDTMDDGRLEGFDWLVFSAAADIRNIPQDGSVAPEAFYTKANDKAVPRVFTAAQKLGIKRSVYIGTFYPQVAPERIGVCPYVTSRHRTDEAVRALSCEVFNVCSLNAPFVLGHIPDLDIDYIQGLVAYAKGQLTELPVFAPVGGTNHISTRSIAQATLSALEKGCSGKAYLLGDENMSWKDYLEMWFEAAGNPQELKTRECNPPRKPQRL